MKKRRVSQLVHSPANRGTLEQEFWRRVEKRGPDECWPWQGTRHDQGYGTFMYKGVRYRASHVAYWIRTGQWPEHLGCHTCDNPPCANPAHIWDGTYVQNAQDMIAKGRGIGIAPDREKVIALRKTGMSGADIAAELGCAGSTIGKILVRAGFKTYKRIGAEETKDIVARYRRGEPVMMIAETYKVSRKKIYAVLSLPRKTRKHK